MTGNGRLENEIEGYSCLSNSYTEEVNMAKHANKVPGAASIRYRMSELVDAASVSRDMIKYYLRARLLPKPRKPRPNLSLYSEKHLLLIRLILRIQQQTTLSLREIAKVFQAANYDPTTIEIELLSHKFHTGRQDAIIPFAAETNPRVSLSFPQAFIEELVSNGLVEAAYPLNDSQIEIAGLMWAARNEGVPISFFQAAREKLQELAELEVKALIAIQRPDEDYNAVVNSVTNTDRVINRWIISEKTGLARHMFQRIIENSEKALSTIHEAIYFPSKVFRKRFQIDEELENLRSLDTKKRDLHSIHNACRACLLLTEFERAVAFANSALEVAPDDDLAIACKSLAYSLANNLDQAQVYAKRLEASDSRHTIALEARLLALLMQAAKLGGMSDTTDLLKKAVELFRDPISVPPKDEFDRLEACLLQARANTIFPDAISKGSEAIRDLESMLENLEGHTYYDLGLPIAAVHVVYQVYASFYLGQLHEAGGNEIQAGKYYEKVIQLDPSSNFGEMAYLKLG
jgi:DNA-binding transcriptional MerR regulator